MVLYPVLSLGESFQLCVPVYLTCAESFICRARSVADLGLQRRFRSAAATGERVREGGGAREGRAREGESASGRECEWERVRVGEHGREGTSGECTRGRVGSAREGEGTRDRESMSGKSVNGGKHEKGCPPLVRGGWGCLPGNFAKLNIIWWHFLILWPCFDLM